jgi:glutamate-ammonia-ligase adenylyltransferase
MEVTIASIEAALARAKDHAPFLRRLIERHPALVDRLRDGGVGDALAEAAAARAEGATVAAGLRQERAALALIVAIFDLAGRWPLEAVTETLSDFADRALDEAIATAFEERFPGEPVRGFAVVALGKHGSRELNYSSDIDPMLLFDPASLPHRASEEPVESAVRLAQRVVGLLQDKRDGGQVFRVDLRLRPAPEVSPIAVPVDAAISYYESLALPWERAVFVRARACAGDRALGEGFLDMIAPFVWRRSLDYGAIGEIRDISHRIRDNHAPGQAFGPGFDLKRGRGGIREVEFFAQIHQLIYGGREPALRQPATMPALAALADAGRIDSATAEALSTAYRLHRTIEHRLQMVEDQQTHRLSRDSAALDGVARLHGLGDGAALLALLAPHVAAVGGHYDTLLGDGGNGLPHDPDMLEAALQAAGFPDPAPARARIEGWRAARARALRSGAAQSALEAVMPALVEAIGAGPHPMTALNRFDAFVERLPTAVQFFRLLEARPALVATIGAVLSHAPPLADALARTPNLVDGLIDASAFDETPTVERLVDRFSTGERGDDYQSLLDRVQRLVGERRFALGVQLIEHRADPLTVGAGYARVAEATIQTIAAATIAEFETAHGRVPDSELVIIGLGRLGGGVLTYASDLDLVFLFTGDFMGESDGPKPLAATLYFNRLAQRVTGALGVRTASGAFYEVDTRLRPSGNQGPIAVTLDSFIRYQRESAWTWEHMALIRARPVFGGAAARAATQAVIAEALGRPREDARLTADVVAMRHEIATHKPPAGMLDVKLMPGGLVDLEFTTHLLQLRHRTALVPSLDEGLAMLAAEGRLPAALLDASALLTRMLVTLRLVTPDGDDLPEESRGIVARACGHDDWSSLLAAYAMARQTVSECWRQAAMIEEGMT